MYSRSAGKHAARSAEAQEEANRLVEQFDEEDRRDKKARDEAETTRGFEAARRQAALIQVDAGGDGGVLIFTNRTGRLITGLRVVGVIDQDTGRKADWTPRNLEAADRMGSLSHGADAIFNLTYPGPGTREHNMAPQFAQGPLEITYRFTDSDGQRWSLDDEGVAQAVPADDSDLT